jgi:hypothetical protein
MKRAGTIKSKMRGAKVARWGGLLAGALVAANAGAQTHKVAKPEDVVRAVGVYEWTGDMAKPAASRLIPVTLFIDGKLEDAAIYLARPVPLALLTDNVYELDKSGVPLGTFDLAYARHLVAPETATTTYDDGWFGYGKFVPPAPPKKSTLKPAATLPVISTGDDDPDKPHFSSKSAVPGSGGSAKGVGSPTASDAPPDDPDRPTLHRSTPSASSGQGTSGSSGGDNAGTSSGAPPDDPDRPTLRRRSADENKKSQNSKNDQAGVTGNADALNDDPNRPTLHRGKPVGGGAKGDDLPKLAGLPVDLHQMVAVSDPKDRPVHDFSRPWDDDAQRQDILEKMETAARAQLKVYEAANAPAPPAAPAKAAPATAASRVAAARAKKPVAPPPAPPEPLLDEELKGYTLSYGGAPTYVYSAHTDGLGNDLRYVTVVAQVDMQGEPEIALKTVTDANHLDRTPWYRLVDAVDVEASNRASLLFELRGKNSRQFAIYRVIGARADQTFATGTTQ